MDEGSESQEMEKLIKKDLLDNSKKLTNPRSLTPGSSGERDDSGYSGCGSKEASSTASMDAEIEDFQDNSCATISKSSTDAKNLATMSMNILPLNDGESSGLSSSHEAQPCHSGSVAGSSGIKKRTTTSQSRNYRNSNLQADAESSHDGDFFTGTGSNEQRKARNDSDSDDSDWDIPFKFMKGDAGAQDGNGTNNREDQTNEVPTVDTGPELSSSSHRSTTPNSEVDFNDFDDGDDNTAEHSSGSSLMSMEQARRSSSSSSSSFAENSESSSSSSDDYLEDLDEQPTTMTRRLEEESDGDGTAVPGASTSWSSSSPKKKVGKEVPTHTKQKLSTPKVLLKPKPKHAWSAPKELLRREMGLSGRVQPQSAEIFCSRFYGCLLSAERLELMKKLEGHRGCVNSLNFNYSGTRLASGSDDLFIKIWNFTVGKCISSFLSGHKANVFQAKFVPFNGLDTMIVSCARDNQVRLTELNSSGEVCSSRKLAQHRGPAHKLSINPEDPHVVLSCGEDGVVFNIDVREDKPERLVKVWEKEKKIALYSIHQNPLSPHEFCVSGKDQYVRIYDKRKLRTPSVPVASNGGESSDGASASRRCASKTDNAPLKKFCPHHLVDSQTKTNVTAAMYNYNGNEIVASYNDENIYLFNATHSDGADCTKVYEGHRNSATVKGVNFFGARSQFVVSGSDCGNIFIWDKEKESVVNFFRADENGVVNCLEGHPTAPILATSGLDDDIKIWIPSNEHAPKMSELATTVRKNLKGREQNSKDTDVDGHIMWALWSHLRQADRERRRTAGDGSDSNDSWWRDEEDDDDDDETVDFASRGVECSIC